MDFVTLGEARETLSALVERAESKHDIITITRHGRPAAVLKSTDDLDSLRETIHWLSRPETVETVAEAQREYAAGATTSLDDLRAAYGLPPR